MEKKAEVADEVIVQAFAVFNFIAKEEIPNMKVLPLTDFLTQYGIQDMKYFTHRSERCKQEIFLAIGQVLKGKVVQTVANGGYIAVMKQLVTFVQYVSDAQIHTKFLSIQNLLITTRVQTLMPSWMQ